ncbi:MAG: type II toxin-antitoxin system RatA family toxin [Gammaproteobacteria bacterium]|nr:MAG: type II toxin-antitoxin system RatA family toxin [Gammaproteobacteria bacterium]
MREITRSAIVPATPAQMFELVADVERYPEFLPFCTAAELLARDPQSLTGRITVSQGPLQASFTTRNELEPPRRMTLALVDGPFSELQGEWEFEPLGENGCRAQLQLRFGFANRAQDLLLGKVFEQTCNRLVDAFVRRAAEIHGP